MTLIDLLSINQKYRLSGIVDILHFLGKTKYVVIVLKDITRGWVTKSSATCAGKCGVANARENIDIARITCYRDRFRLSRRSCNHN